MSQHPFWRFSLHLYAQAGVEAACLALQEQGADVNLLLLCCWLGGQGRSLDRRRLRALMAAVAAWQSAIVLPLRQLRRSLRRETWRVDARQRLALRQRVAASELEAERLEQELLASRVVDLPRLRRQHLVAANLWRYAAVLGLDADAGPHWRALLAAGGDC